MGMTSMTLVAALKAKLLAVTLAGALTVGGGAAGATLAATGAFGPQVAAQVVACKQALAVGSHGIGQCVAPFAQQKGTQQRSQHAQNTGAASATASNAKQHATSGAGAAHSATHGSSASAAARHSGHGGPPNTAGRQ